MDLDYYLRTDEKYHDEVYELLLILETDQVDDEAAAQIAAAEERLDELVRISNT